MRALRKRGTDEVFPWAPVLSEREDMEDGEFNPESGVFTSSEMTVRPESEPEKPKRVRVPKKEAGKPAEGDGLTVNEPLIGLATTGEEEELLEEEDGNTGGTD